MLEDPTYLVRWPFITWSRDKCKTLYLHFINIYGQQIWQSGNLRWRDPAFKVMWPFDYMVTWQMKKTYIWTSTIPMATKLGWVVTFGQKTSHTKLHDLLITWSRDKYKTLCLHFCSTYDHKTGQSGILWWRDHNFKVTRLFDYLVTWKTKKTYICTSTIHMAAKLGRVVIYGWKTLPTKSCDLLITWSRDKWKETYTYTYTISMVTTLEKVVTYTGRSPPTNSRDLFISWSHDKWKTL